MHANVDVDGLFRHTSVCLETIMFIVKQINLGSVGFIILSEIKIALSWFSHSRTLWRASSLYKMLSKQHPKNNHQRFRPSACLTREHTAASSHRAMVTRRQPVIADTWRESHHKIFPQLFSRTNGWECAIIGGGVQHSFCAVNAKTAIAKFRRVNNNIIFNGRFG